jgi:hypothetical protein
MKFIPVKPILFLASIALMGGTGISTASAVGCLTGAAVGGVAGHMAGHGVWGLRLGAPSDTTRSKKAKAAAEGSCLRTLRLGVLI